MSVRVGQKSGQRYLDENGPMLTRVFTWILGVIAYLAMLTDRLPTRDEQRVRFEVERSGSPTVGSTLLRILYSIPSLIVLAILVFVGAFVWLLAVVLVLVNERYPESAWRFLCGLVRWEAYLFAYLASLTIAIHRSRSRRAPFLPRLRRARRSEHGFREVRWMRALFRRGGRGRAHPSHSSLWRDGLHLGLGGGRPRPDRSGDHLRPSGVRPVGRRARTLDIHSHGRRRGAARVFGSSARRRCRYERRGGDRCRTWRYAVQTWFGLSSRTNSRGGLPVTFPPVRRSGRWPRSDRSFSSAGKRTLPRRCFARRTPTVMVEARGTRSLRSGGGQAGKTRGQP
jgi:hypothetical protein